MSCLRCHVVFALAFEVILLLMPTQRTRPDVAVASWHLVEHCEVLVVTPSGIKQMAHTCVES